MGFSALIMLLACLGLVLGRIHDRLDLLSDESRRRQEEAWRAQREAEQEREQQELRDYYRGLGHGAAQQLRALSIRRAHVAEIRRGRWRRRAVWLRSLPGRFHAGLRGAVGEENQILLVFVYCLLCLILLTAVGIVTGLMSWATFLH